MAVPIPLFVAPTSLEYAAVRNGLTPALAANQIRLELCGVGEKNTAEFCKQLNSETISCLVLLGLAGGLMSGLPVGKVIIASSVLQVGKPEITCFPLEIAGGLRGAILTSPVGLLTPSQKQAAGEGGAVAVEMEAYPLAAWATKNDVPFVHGRVILDPMEETLPDTGSFLDTADKLHWLSLIKSVLRHPGLIVSLIRIYSRARTLDAVLGKLAVNCLQAIKETSLHIQRN